MKYTIEQLAVLFRNAPAAPAHNHVDVYNAIESVGGRAAITYGQWIATPFRQRWKKRDRGISVADALDAAAKKRIALPSDELANQHWLCAKCGIKQSELCFCAHLARGKYSMDLCEKCFSESPACGMTGGFSPRKWKQLLKFVTTK